MNKRWIVAIGLMVALTTPAALLAHGGHTHKVMGTVSSVDGNKVEIKATDGKAVAITLNEKTAITRGKAKLDVTALKPGERVSIDYMQEKDANVATAVKLGTAQAAATTK